MKKFFATLLAAAVFLINTVFYAPAAYADWEFPKFDFPKIELPHVELPKYKFQLPDKIDIPGTPFSYYPRESVGGNVVKNILPFAGGMLDYLNPMKPVA